MGPVLASLILVATGVAAPASPASAVLVYLSTPRTLLIWHASDSRRLALDSVPVGRDSLAVLIARLRAAVASTEDLESCRATKPSGDAAAAARALAEVVLPAPVRRSLPASGEILIVPQGALQLVPFALLPVDQAPGLLGLRNALRYTPSLASLAEAERRRATRPSDRSAWRRALVVGNPQMPSLAVCGTRVRLNALTRAGAFSQWLADTLNASLLSGPSATEGEVHRRIGAAPLVHLATHGYGFTAQERARDSWVALSAGEGDDGFLTVAEILARDSLTAELVVLAACETGLGDAKNAEGVVGLQRALLARGARSVLASLWPVNEAATVRLLEVFYRQWLYARDRPSKAEALRRAQEAVRSDVTHPEWLSPEYWAGFILVGAG